MINYITTEKSFLNKGKTNDVITYKPSSPGAADFISLAKEVIKIK